MAKIILGFMGSGKTTVAKLLDKHFIDMDVLITEKIGMPIADFFASQGEAAFRQIESQVLADLIKSDCWVSTGGGVVTSPINRELLKTNNCNIYLKADFDTLYNRIAKDKDNQRPLFLNNSKEDFYRLFQSRLELYEEVATQVITVDDKSPEQIVEMIK